MTSVLLLYVDVNGHCHGRGLNRGLAFAPTRLRKTERDCRRVGILIVLGTDKYGELLKILATSPADGAAV